MARYRSSARVRAFNRRYPPKRRRYDRRRRRTYARRPRLRRPLPLGGFPAKKLVHLRYVDAVAMNPTTTTISHIGYKANSVHDPDVGSHSTTHQPSNFDRWAANYKRYCVIASKITVWPVIESTGNAVPGTLAVCASKDGDKLTTAYGNGFTNHVLEEPGVASNKSYSISGVNNSAYRPLKAYFSAKKAFGGNLLNSAAGSAVTSDPTHQWHFEVGYMSPSDSTDPAQMTFRVQLDYIVVFTERLGTSYSTA